VQRVIKQKLIGKERKGKLLRRYKETCLGRGGVDLFSKSFWREVF